MEMSYSADLPEIDAPAVQAAAARPNGGVKMRLQPGLLTAKGTYQAWSGVSWTVSCANAAEAIAVREALRACFAAIASRGADGVTRMLEAVAEGQVVAR